MKRNQIVSIFLALAIGAVSAVALTGCTGREYRIDNGQEVAVEESSDQTGTEETAESSITPIEASDESSEESSEAESSEESNQEESADDESSEEESSEDESSEEESSEDESSEEESSEDDGAKKAQITFKKPDDWGDKILVKVYEKGGVAGTGEAMTDNSDGTYSYTVTYENPDAELLVIFSEEGKPRNQYPKANGEAVEDGKTYSVE